MSGESNFVVKLAITSKEGDNLSEVAAVDDTVEVKIVGLSLLAVLDADEVIIIDSDVDVVYEELDLVSVVEVGVM